MGSCASVTPAMTIESITKVDVATNTNYDDSSSIVTPIIDVVKQLVEVSTQTDDLQSNLKTNQIGSSDEINNKNFNLISDDLQQISDNDDELIERTDDHINPRFNQNLDDREELEWMLNDMDANQFCINNQTLYMSAGQVTPAMVVDAMEKMDELKNLPKTVWNLLKKARKTGDATYLIRAYTAETNLYKILNRRLARQTLGNPLDMTFEEQLQTIMGTAFTQMNQAISVMQAFQAGQQAPIQSSNETNWAKLYLQAIYRLIVTPNSTLRYEGRTYRGMRLTFEELHHYLDATQICNKAITSTSKLRSIAQNFIDTGPRPQNMFDVMFIYVVESFCAVMAIDIQTLSLMSHEEEVLLMPGILFTIGQVNHTSPYSVEIEMHSVLQDLANGGLANCLAS